MLFAADRVPNRGVAIVHQNPSPNRLKVVPLPGGPPAAVSPMRRKLARGSHVRNKLNKHSTLNPPNPSRDLVKPWDWRLLTWLIVLWCAAIVLWVALAINTDAGSVQRCFNQGVLTFRECRAATGVGVGLGATAIAIVGVVGFVLLALVWLMTKPARRPCPVCGYEVPRGRTTCSSCSYDFARARIPS